MIMPKNVTEYNIREKLLKKLIDIGVIMCFFGMIEQIVVQPCIKSIMLMVILLVSLIIGHILSSNLNRTDLAAIVIGVVAIYVVFPLMYFNNGGIMGGAPVWFVLGIFYIIGIFDGIKMYLFLILAIMADIAVYLIGYKYPKLIIPIESNFLAVLDSLFAIVFVGIFLGMIMKFQLKSYSKAREIAIYQKNETEKISASRSKLFANMSHEIRTPINTIIGLDEMILRDDTISDEVAENAAVIQNAGIMLLSLVNDILDFSQIENKKMRIYDVSYNTQEMFSELISVIRNRIESKGLAFYVNIEHTLPSVLCGDPKRIKQVLLNILVNAAKYTKEGSVTLTANSEIISDKRCKITVSVADTGIGIKKEVIDRIFDSFSRADGSEINRIEGTGLGLSICKQLMDLMGGEITVDSIYTKGSVFSIVLEQDIIDGSPIGNIDFLAKKEGEHTKFRHLFEAPDVRVLVVDDNDASRMVTVKLLRGTKVQIDEANSALEALNLTCQRYYNIILLDYMMPEINGVEALQKIKQQENGLCRGSQVLLMTAEGERNVINDIMQEGFDGYIEKPLEGNRLEASIMSHIPNEFLEYCIDTHYVSEKSLAGDMQEKADVLKKKLIITTDCVCDIPIEEAKSMSVKQVYQYINTPGGRFKDTVEIGIDNISDMILNDRKKISVSAVSVEDYEDFFATRLTEAKEIIHISVAMNLGKSYYNASNAAKCFGSVNVVNSGQLSCGMRIVLKYAAQKLSEGADAKEVITMINSIQGRIKAEFLLDSIEPFYENGFVGKRKKIIFEALNLHPILVVKRSSLHIRSFMVGDFDKARVRFVKRTVKKLKGRQISDINISHSGIPVKEQELIAAIIEKNVNCDDFVIEKSSVTNACISGPGTIGIATYIDKQK